MTTLYIYTAEDNTLVARISGASNLACEAGGTGIHKGNIMMWQIEQYSTGKVLSQQLVDTDGCERMIELIAHITGISVDDLDAVCIIENSFFLS